MLQDCGLYKISNNKAVLAESTTESQEVRIRQPHPLRDQARPGHHILGDTSPEQAKIKAWSVRSTTEKEIKYIVRSINKSLDIVPGSTVTSNFNELATRFPRLSAPIGEARVRFLGVRERSLQNLVTCVSGSCSPHRRPKVTLYDTQISGSTTPSRTTCPARYIILSIIV